MCIGRKSQKMCWEKPNSTLPNGTGKAIPLMKSVNMQETKRARQISSSYNKDKCAFNRIADTTDLKAHEDFKDQLLEL